LSKLSLSGLLADIIASSVARAVTLGKISASAGRSLNRGLEPGEPVWLAGPDIIASILLSGGKATRRPESRS